MASGDALIRAKQRGMEILPLTQNDTYKMKNLHLRETSRPEFLQNWSHDFLVFCISAIIFQDE